MIVIGGISVAAIGIGVLGQFHFPTTGIETQGRAMLLAIDDASLPLKRNLCYYITKPTVHPEPVITPSRDNPNAVDYLGCHFYGAVLYEDGKFRMWYYPVSLGRNPDLSPEQKALTENWKHDLWLGTVCYAESDDGIHWTKPNLGQLLFKGNRDNNALDLPDALIEGVHLIRDDDDPDPNRRYKMVCNVFPQSLPTIRTATSPDGIHWTAAKDTAVGGDFIEESSFYKFNGLYFVNGQVSAVGEGGRGLGRSGFVRISPDFDHWLPESGESFLLPDPADAGKTVEHGRRDETHIGVGAAPFGNVLVGLYCIWHNDEDFSKITGDFGLVVSNDGIAFREPVKGYRWLTAQESAATPVPGQDYPTILCQGNGILNVGDETRIYHGRWRNVRYSGSGAKPEDYYAEIGLATIPRDRWGALGLFPGQTDGSVWSCPVTLPEGGCEVVVNADGADGMRVEVGDEQFNLLGDFSGEVSGTPSVGSGLDVPVKWPKADLAELGGKTVRFRIQVTKVGDVEPRLYCVYLIPPVNAPKVPMAQYEAEEFSLTVGERTITAKILSPPAERLAKDPALLITFATDRDTALLQPPYCQPAQYFVANGHRAVSFDLPAHGERVDPKYGEGITGWRNAFVAGDEVFTQFVEQGRAVIDECIQRGWATPGRIAVGGTSRGGYMALRLLAGDDRIAAGAGFAPVTDWRDLAEFAADREREDVTDLRLSRFARDMVGKHVFLAIGSDDQRVSTLSCRHLADSLKRAEERQGIAATRVWYGETEEVGHAMGDGWYSVGEEFLLLHVTR